MRFYRRILLRLYYDRRAVTALEYAIIAGIIVTTIVVGFTSLGDALSNKFSNIGGSIVIGAKARALARFSLAPIRRRGLSTSCAAATRPFRAKPSRA
jgi:Flp pilus assembly pilin Flp